MWREARGLGRGPVKGFRTFLSYFDSHLSHFCNFGTLSCILLVFSTFFGILSRNCNVINCGADKVGHGGVSAKFLMSNLLIQTGTSPEVLNMSHVSTWRRGLVGPPAGLPPRVESKKKGYGQIGTWRNCQNVDKFSAPGCARVGTSRHQVSSHEPPSFGLGKGALGDQGPVLWTSAKGCAGENGVLTCFSILADCSLCEDLSWNASEVLS